MNLSHRQRIENTISGQKVDRPAVSLWRHFPVDDQAPETLARAVINFQERFDFDFIKITSASSFCVKDWGARDEWKGNPEGTCAYTSHPIQDFEDLFKIKPISPKKGSLGDQLKCIDLVKKGVPNSTPVIQTIFSPLSQLKNLVGKENLGYWLRTRPNEVESVLRIISEVTIDFISECKRLDIDGIFYAVQQAQFSLLNVEEFRRFGKTFDLQVLEAAKSFWFNVGHIHGSQIMFEELVDYPFQVLNWHDLETEPGLDKGKELFRKGAVCGGLRQWETLAYSDPDQVREEAVKAISQTNSERFILGTGCVTPIITPESNIFAAREVVDAFSGVNI